MTRVAARLQPFGVTIFTEMSALAAEVGAINLGQGFPNWDGADLAKQAAIASMASGNDQYPPSHGIPELRWAIARRYGPRLGRSIDPDVEVTVTTGCTEALAASMLGLVEPGDEVVVIEPFYDAYPADLALAGAIPGSSPSPTRLRSRPRRVGGGVLTPDQGDPGQHATQPDRSGPFRGRDGCHRPAVHRARHNRHHRRGLRGDGVRTSPPPAGRA